MDIQEKDVKVKMSLCQKCGNVVTVAIEHKMTNQTKKDFMKEVLKYNLDVKTIPLEEYRQGNIKMGCNEDCDIK